MNKKKIGLIVVVLFLLIGLGSFVFANPNKKENLKKKGESVEETQKVEDEKWKEDEVEESDDDSVQELTEDSNYLYTINNDNNKNNSSSINNNGSNSTVIADDSYDKALAAVVKAESSFTQGDVDNADELVNKVTDSTRKEELKNRLEAVQNTIDAEKLVVKLENKVNVSKNELDINDARDYRTESEVEKIVSELQGSTQKEKLEQRLEAVAKILNDNESPIITGITDNSFTKGDVALTIEDTNDVTTQVTINGEESEYTGTFDKEGTYVVTVTDAAFNKTTLTFTIDKTKPTVGGVENGKYYNSDVAVTVDDTNPGTIHLKKDGELVKPYNSGDLITEEGTYTVVVTDKAGNKSSQITFVIDKTAPTFNFNNGNIFASKEIVVNDENFDYMVLYNYNIKEEVKVTTNTYMMNSGNTMYKVTAYDKAGNISEIWIYHDNLVPTFSGTGIQGANNVEFKDGGKYQSLNLNIVDTNLKEVKLINTETKEESKLCSFSWNDDKTCQLSFTDSGNYQLVAIDRANNESKVNFTIGKAKTEIKLSAPESLVYDTKAKNYTATLYDEYGNKVAIDLDTVYDDETGRIPEAINVGKYVAISYFGGNDIYEKSYVREDFEITPATPTIELTAPNLTYDGKEKSYGVKVYGADGKEIEAPDMVIIYKKGNEEIYNTNNKDKGNLPVDAGTYTLGIYVRGNENYTRADKWISFEITPATPTIKLDTPNLVYDGNKKEYGIRILDVFGNPLENVSMNVVYKDAATNEELDEAPTNPGKYILGIYVRPMDNYTRADKWINFEILSNLTVGGVGYNSLVEAVANSNGQPIILNNDITSNAINIGQGQNVTIDLNGHNINFNSNQRFNVNSGVLNLTGKGTVKELSPYFAPVLISRSATDTVLDPIEVNVGKDVTLEGWSGIFIDQNKTYTVANTTVNLEGSINSVLDTTGIAGHGIYINGLVKNLTNYPVINIKSTANIKSLGDGIYAAGYAEWNIDGGYIEAPSMAIGIKSGKLNISGGTFIATGERGIPTPVGNNGIAGSGAALQIESNSGYASNMEINISGGTFESKQSASVYEYSDSEATQVNKINISGGTFISGSNDSNLLMTDYLYNKFVGFVTGGTYNKDITKYVAEGYKLENQDGNYIVKKNN